MSICRDIIRHEGARTFFTGMTPTLAREVPGYFFFFGAYEGARHLFTRPDQTKDDIGQSNAHYSTDIMLQAF